jgi:NADH-quinone oxidoreductase subunit N
MNYSLVSLEIWVVAAGLVLLLADLWAPPRLKRPIGYFAAAAVGIILLFSFSFEQALPTLQAAHAPLGAGPDLPQFAFGQSYVLDGLALFFKRFFLVAAIFVLIMAAQFADQLESGIAEYYSLVLFALAGMMLAASANSFPVLFAALELITVTFYVLTSFQRRRLESLEAGAKYLILGALSTAFLVYGIALVFGVSNTMAFDELAKKSAGLVANPLFLVGLLFVLAGLGFKIAVVPFQMWAPDVYQGSPTPTTAFLAVGSKAAGFVLLLRLLQSALPDVAVHWNKLLLAVAGATILYGNLCALPQTNLKRLLGYSSIANAGYLLMGLLAMSQAGSAAILYFLAGYLFTLMAAFTVISIILLQTESADLGSLAGLSQRSPFLAAVMALAMVSLAGVPPLAGFFGKFLLIKAVLEQGARNHAFFWIAGVAIIGVVISLYYYFGVIRAIYWAKGAADLSPIRVSWLHRLALTACAAGMLYLGVLPERLLSLAATAVKALRLG